MKFIGATLFNALDDSCRPACVIFQEKHGVWYAASLTVVQVASDRFTIRSAAWIDLSLVGKMRQELRSAFEIVE